MIRTVTHEQKDDCRDLINDMHRARHQLYVEGRKWRELAKADGLEVDQFDTDSTVYLLALSKSKSLQGGLRLLPTLQPHMLDSLFPDLCTITKLPKGPRIWEMSRVFVNHTDTHDENGLLLKGKLMCAMFEYAETVGIEQIIGVADSYFLPRLLEIGINVRPLGMPKPYESGEMVAIQILIDSSTLEKAQRHYKVPYSVLEKTAESVDSSELEHLNLISAEAELLTRKGFIGDREEQIQEFVEIVKLLGEQNSDVTKLAEKRLEKLTAEVRMSLLGNNKNFHHKNSTLQ